MTAQERLDLYRRVLCGDDLICDALADALADWRESEDDRALLDRLYFICTAIEEGTDDGLL